MAYPTGDQHSRSEPDWAGLPTHFRFPVPQEVNLLVDVVLDVLQRPGVISLENASRMAEARREQTEQKRARTFLGARVAARLFATLQAAAFEKASWVVAKAWSEGRVRKWIWLLSVVLGAFQLYVVREFLALFLLFSLIYVALVCLGFALLLLVHLAGCGKAWAESCVTALARVARHRIALNEGFMITNAVPRLP